MPRKKKEKVSHKPFFDKEFFWVILACKEPANPEKQKEAEEKISTFYAPAVRLINNIGRSDKQNRVKAEIQSILGAKDRRASLLRFFFKEFMGKISVKEFLSHSG